MFNVKTSIKTAFGIGTASILTSCAVLKTNVCPNNIIAIEQAEKDSLFYRTIFNQTVAAKDSGAVAEFNKIAADMKSITKEKRSAVLHEIVGNAEKNGITKAQKNVLDGIQYISNSLAIKEKQIYADKFVYENLFKKYGISDILK